MDLIRQRPKNDWRGSRLDYEAWERFAQTPCGINVLVSLWEESLTCSAPEITEHSYEVNDTVDSSVIFCHMSESSQQPILLLAGETDSTQLW